MPGPRPGIDGRGRTLLPGLIDAHAHYTFDPTEGSIADDRPRSDAEIVLAAAGHAALALRAGVTTARGAGSIRNLEVVGLRDAIAAGQVPGPRLIVAGTAVGITGGHGYAFGLEADGPEALVDRHAPGGPRRRGCRQGGRLGGGDADDDRPRAGPDRPWRAGADRGELRAIVETAAELGVKVMSHAQDAESVRRSAAAGVDSVEHAWLADRDAIEALATLAARSSSRPWSSPTSTGRSPG